MIFSKENLLGHGIGFICVLATFILMFLGGLKFLIISLIFFGCGGLFEFLVMMKFSGKGYKKIFKKDSFRKKLSDGFLWVHGIFVFIGSYHTTIYNFKKLGFLPNFFSYFIMFIYVLISLLLFQYYENYFVFLIYLFPVITNLYAFFYFYYFIFKRN